MTTPSDRGRAGQQAGPFIAGLNKALERMSQSNHFAQFLFSQIRQDLRWVSEKREKLARRRGHRTNLVSHAIPIKNKGFKFFHLNFDPNDRAFGRETDELLEFLKTGENWKSFESTKKAYYARKEGRTVKAILSLSKDFLGHMVKISDETEIPISSLQRLFEVMTCNEGMLKSPLTMRILENYAQIDVPAGIQAKDHLVLKISDQIYNLLVESFWVLVVAGMDNFITLRNFLIREGLKKAKLFLLHEACYIEMEDRVRAISSVGDLVVYLKEEKYEIFYSFFPVFRSFYKKAVQQIIEKRTQFAPPYIPAEYPKIKKDKRISKEVLDRIQERIFARIFNEAPDIKDQIETDYFGEDVGAESTDQRNNPGEEYRLGRDLVDIFSGKSFQEWVTPMSILM